MKNILLVAILSMIFIIDVSAQPPMGGGGRGGRSQGRGQGGAPRGGQFQNQQEEQISVMRLPDIPDLTAEQREKLVKNIADEQKDVRKLMREKMQLEFQLNDPNSTVNPEKQAKKIDGIEKKIKKAADKYDKKIRKILTAEQYSVFVVKKEEIEFSKPQRRSPQGNRPPGGRRQQGDPSQGDDNQSPPPMQDSPGGWGAPPDDF